MTRYVRSKSRIVGSISMPLFFLLFLGFGLNLVVSMQGFGENYIQFLIPGMVAMIRDSTSWSSEDLPA